jgi:hypothetical protein
MKITSNIPDLSNARYTPTYAETIMKNASSSLQ